jgi:hypothetical protein
MCEKCDEALEEDGLSLSRLGSATRDSKQANQMSPKFWFVIGVVAGFWR